MRTVEEVVQSMAAGLVSDGVLHADQVEGMTAFLRTVVSAHRQELDEVRDMLRVFSLTNEEILAINDQLLAANAKGTTLSEQLLSMNADLLGANKQLLTANQDLLTSNKLLTASNEALLE